MSTVRKHSRNILTTWAGYITQVAVAFFLTPIVLEELGELRFGAWALMIGIVGYYGLLDIGFRPGLLSKISSAIGKDDEQEISRVASSGFFSMAVIGFLIFLASLVVANSLSFFVEYDSKLSDEISWCVIIMGAGTALQFPLFTFAAALNAVDRFDVSNAIGTISRLIYAFTAIGLLRQGCSLVALSALLVASNLFDYCLRYFFAKKFVPGSRIYFSKWSWSTTRRILGFGSWLSLSTVGTRLAQYSDLLIVGMFVSPVGIAAYTLASSLAGHVERFVGPIATMLFPTATRLVASNKIEDLISLYWNATRISIGVSFIFAVLSIQYAKAFLVIWVGDDASDSTITDATNAYFMLAIAGVAVNWQMVGRQIVMAKGKPHLMALLLLPESAFNLAISIYLAPRLGVKGVAAGTMVAAVLFQCFVFPVVVSRVTKLGLSRMLSKTMPRPCIFLAALLLVSTLTAVSMETAKTWSTLFSQASLSLFLAILLFMTIVLKPTERLYVWKQLRKFVPIQWIS